MFLKKLACFLCPYIFGGLYLSLCHNTVSVGSNFELKTWVSARQYSSLLLLMVLLCKTECSDLKKLLLWYLVTPY